jgi:2-polyprenyl-3-methyl-5-hydroxy-6-metoxy-1,4-benzoquinol methylase
MATELHAARLDTIAGHILAQGGRRLLDLGCGPGELLERIAPAAVFDEILGVDIDQRVLDQARNNLAPLHKNIRFQRASFCSPHAAFEGFDVATLIETIEHVDPNRLDGIEAVIFTKARPGCVFVSTPNQDFNVCHGMRPGQMRHPDHRFEWGRQRFRSWSQRIANRYGYRVIFYDVGDVVPQIGASTQMAVFHNKG